MKTTDRTFQNTVDRDLYSTRVWVELDDGASRADNTSVEGILVQTHHEVLDKKI